ncbi:MAG: LamG-like jellyroll fold domain-containing protein [Verrucomicrobiales bacterium]
MNSTHLVLPGTGSGAGAANMGFSSVIGIGSNFGASGVSIESWYTDNNTGTWGKLYTFGTSSAGQELAFTNFRGGGDLAPGIDRNGAHFLSGYPQGSNTRIPTGVEHHLVMTVAADGTTNLWLNGTPQITNLATNALSNVVSSTESIGATAWGDPGHNGTVNEFRIWSGTLTGEEVTRNLAFGPDVIPEPMVLSLVALGLLGILRRRR